MGIYIGGKSYKPYYTVNGEKREITSAHYTAYETKHLVYQKTSGSYLYNCTVTDNGNGLTLTPIDPYTYYYAFLKGSPALDINSFSLSLDSDYTVDGESPWTQVSVMWGSITPTTTILTERPSASQTNFAFYSTHSSNSAGENIGRYYADGTASLVSSYYYPSASFSWQFDDSDLNGTATLSITDGQTEETLYISGTPFDGAVLVWANPSSYGGTPIVGSMSVSLNGANGLAAWS